MLVNSQTNFQESENAYHTGIYACCFRLAEILADNGIDATIQKLEAERAATNHKHERDDLHFLIKGIEDLDRAQLHASVEPLYKLVRDHASAAELAQQQEDALALARQEWDAAAAIAQQEMRIWQQWALDTERTRIEATSISPRRIPLSPLTYRPFQEFGNCATLFKSPEHFAYNFAYFERLVSAVDEVIEAAHLARQLPADLDVRQFHVAIKTMASCKTKFEQAAQRERSASDDLEGVWHECKARTAALAELLMRMDRIAVRSLFDLFEPLLRERPAA